MSALRILAAFLVVLVETGCAHCEFAWFQGEDITTTAGTLKVKADKAADRVHLASPRYGYTLSLPYSEDWSFISYFEELSVEPVKVLLAVSPRLKWFVTLQMCQPTEMAREGEETRLRHCMNRQRVWLTGYGVDMQDHSFEKDDGHFVLQYAFDEWRGETKFRRQNCWGTRRREGIVYDLQLEHLGLQEPSLAQGRQLMKEIAGRNFEIER